MCLSHVAIKQAAVIDYYGDVTLISMYILILKAIDTT